MKVENKRAEFFPHLWTGIRNFHKRKVTRPEIILFLTLTCRTEKHLQPCGLRSRNLAAFAMVPLIAGIAANHERFSV